VGTHLRFGELAHGPAEDLLLFGGSEVHSRDYTGRRLITKITKVTKITKNSNRRTRSSGVFSPDLMALLFGSFFVVFVILVSFVK